MKGGKNWGEGYFRGFITLVDLEKKKFRFFTPLSEKRGARKKFLTAPFFFKQLEKKKFVPPPPPLEIFIKNPPPVILILSI